MANNSFPFMLVLCIALSKYMCKELAYIDGAHGKLSIEFPFLQISHWGMMSVMCRLFVFFFVFFLALYYPLI